jgi:multicomponent Na+:H+ antiporter subunit G
MIQNIFSGILVSLALIFMGFGVIGIFRLRNFYARILITGKSETVGMITMMFGVIVSAGLSYFSLKAALITALVLITNPIATHTIARSARQGGYAVRKEDTWPLNKSS